MIIRDLLPHHHHPAFELIISILAIHVVVLKELQVQVVPDFSAEWLQAVLWVISLAQVEATHIAGRIVPTLIVVGIMDPPHQEQVAVAVAEEMMRLTPHQVLEALEDDRLN